MKNHLLTLILLISIIPFFGQELPTLIVPSPTAFQMTSFGDIQVNESSGKINPSIPLYNYSSGKLQLPISLNYQGNAVKIDQAAGWTGINWNLNSGGVITRVVRDGDDLMVSRNFYTYEDINAMDFFNNTSDINAINNHVRWTLDSEVDIFYFSFPGYSGSFYFDENFQAHLTKDDSALRIKLDDHPPVDSQGITQGLKRRITITTPKGIEYSFGGLFASEYSKTAMGTEYNIDFAQTAFYLTKIKHPTGDEIYFEYTPEDYTIQTGISEIVTLTVQGTNSVPPFIDDVELDQYKFRNLFNIVRDGQFLNKIHSNKNDYEIIFNTIDATHTQHYTKILKTISVRDSSDVIVQINLDYLYPKGTDSQRFFLRNVNFNDREYSMEYKTPEFLPNRFSFDQDYLGYFNNKANIQYIPKTNHLQFQSIYSNLADKSADFEYGSLGVLTKLTYPTRGYTEFEYESGKLRDVINTITENFHFITYMNDSSRTPVTKNPNGVFIGQSELQSDTSYNITHDISDSDKIIDQNIDIRMSNVSSSEHLDQHTIFELNVFDITENEDVSFNRYTDNHYHYSLGDVTGGGYGAMYTYPNFTFRNIHLLENHQYHISLKIIANSFTNNATINATGSFNCKIKTEGYKDDCNIRIKNIKNYDLNSNNEFEISNRKFYKYFSPNRIFKPIYQYASLKRFCIGPFANPIDIEMINLSSSSLNTIYGNTNNEKIYGKVQIYNVNEGKSDNGYVVKEFIVKNDALIQNALIDFTGFGTGVNFESSFQHKRENKSAVNGTLKKETFYQYYETNNNFKKIKENTYAYNTAIYFDTQHVTNNTRSVLYNNCVNYNDRRQLGPLYLGLYKTYSNPFILESTNTKIYDYSNLIVIDTDGDNIPDYQDSDDDNDGVLDFFEDDDGDNIINANDPDYNPSTEPPLSKFLETNTIYEYGEYVSFPTKIITTTSQDDITYETTNLYPSTEVIDPTYGNIDGLLFNHQISQPLKTERFKRIGTNAPILVASYKNQYSNFNLPLRSLLSKVQTSKGSNPLEDRIIYHNYDNYGNPLEISKANGVHVCYIWGYNNTQPIAKIENINYANIPQSQLNALNSFNYTTGTEVQLLTLLGNLRNVIPSTAMLTTMTYKPLIGVSTVTDPKRDTQYYKYDNFNRLEFVKDKNGNVLSQHEYHYKN